MSETKPVHLRRKRGLHRPKGRGVDAAVREEVRQLLAPLRTEAAALIENLHRLQDCYQHLPAGHLAALAELMNLPMAAVFEVASFYHHFDVVKEGETPPPTVTVRVCESLSCELAGAQGLLTALRAHYGDRVRVKPAPCVGRCAGAPVAVVGQNALEGATVEGVTAAVEEGRTGAVLPVGAESLEGYVAGGGYEVYRRCLSGALTVEGVVATLEESGLRGLGGAGFPAARKWRIVREQPGRKVVAVNIDEGEPGTFKDRHYLERKPHQFVEGTLIAAWAVGAEEVFLYLRDEYHGCRLLLERELAALREWADFELPSLVLRRGAGAYICGEESAMIESIEGKRGEPRLRPPFVAEVGVFNRPTLEHNMETLHWVPEILSAGAALFADNGRNGRKGLRSFSVSGRVARPGVYVAPAGISVRELIDEFCGGMSPGHVFYGFLPGGGVGGDFAGFGGGCAARFR